MATLVPRGSSETCDQHLEDWPTFSTKYYEPVRDCLRFLLRVPEDEAHDVAADFLIKAERNEYLAKYKRSRAEKEARGEKSRHRDYLLQSLKYHVMDLGRRKGRSKEGALTDEAAEALVAPPDDVLDPDTLYALLVLHRALQALRHHCERTGKSHVWTCFQELLLAPEFRGGRPARSLEQLAEDLGRDKQFVHNSLTTGKRAFQRFIHEAIPQGFRDDETANSRFEEWMDILRRSNAAQFNKLHIAYRVFPYIAPDDTQTDSRFLAVDDPAVAYEEPCDLPTEDELSLLLSFRLEMPLHETIPLEELRPLIRAESPLLPIRRAGALAATARPFCLLSLVDPTPDEAEALASVNLRDLLVRLKSLSKQLKSHAKQQDRRPDPGMPEGFATLFYTLASVLALVHKGEKIYSIETRELVQNIRWFLKQSWFDDRLVPIFRRALAIIEPGTARPA